MPSNLRISMEMEIRFDNRANNWLSSLTTLLIIKPVFKKQDDRFYDDLGDDEEETVVELDRRGRFKQAYEVALSTDTQGYMTRQGGITIDRSPQELTAISWAAFCTNILPAEDVLVRIQALDCQDLFERLKLAAHMLKEKKNSLKVAMKKAGIPFKGEEFDENF